MQTQPRDSGRADVCRRILDAAEARYRFYGYRKTTMADIAGDLGMSPANLYRYFESKQALAAAFVRRFFQHRLASAEAAVAAAAGAATRARIQALVAALLHETYHTTVSQPKVSELVDIVTAGHRDMIHALHAAEQGLIARVLAGDASAAVRRQTDRLGRQLHAAIAMFRVPLFMSYYELDELEHRATEVVDLLFDGLASRPGDG